MLFPYCSLRVIRWDFTLICFIRILIVGSYNKFELNRIFINITVGPRLNSSTRPVVRAVCMFIDVVIMYLNITFDESQRAICLSYDFYNVCFPL